MASPLLIGIGEILWDMLAAGKQLGGAPANFACHANVLGGRGVAVSRVGNDSLGREILARLDALGLDRRHVQIDADHPTGTVDVRLDASGVPEYVIHRDVGWDYLQVETSLLELARQADCVCFGSLAQRSAQSRATIQAFIGATRPGCLRIFDVNLRQKYFSRELIDELLSMSDVLKLNDQELPVVARLLDLNAEGDEAIQSLLRRYPLSTIAVTRGVEGSAVYAAHGGVAKHAGIPIDVADTIGAGDAFTAALALGLLSDMPLDEISDRANRVASFVCSQPGATPAIPESFKLAPQMTAGGRG